MDNAVKHMNEAWRKAIMRAARELVGRRRRHVIEIETGGLLEAAVRRLRERKNGEGNSC
jgi:hypothetical protein